jgi:NADPH:quinone reductase-like Zn-dependent oxidoreductase
MVSGLELRSLITREGQLRLSLEERELPEPGPDEVLIRVEAAPLNPTDHFQMTGPADFSTLAAENRLLTMTVPPAALPAVSRRLGESRAVGSEGAGTVIAAGETAKGLLGKRVAANAGGMFAQYRLVKAAACLVLPDGVSPAEGAAAFVNPLTVLGFVETMRMEGFKALVHAAAASNLGQMLLKVCLADGIPLVNIVRKQSQVELLKGLGATHVLDGTAADFEDQLTRAVAETGARLAFDPIGGGRLATQILAAMEAASVPADSQYLVYGTSVPKKVYVYGGLDRGPTIIERRFGFAWGVGGWLLPNFLNRVGPEVAARLRQRVVRELTTTFASHYARTISLSEVLDPDIFRSFQSRATGEKYLIDPTLG